MKKSERNLLIVVVVLAIGFGGTFVYRQYGEEVLSFDQNREEMLEQINTYSKQLENKSKIVAQYEALQRELVMENATSDSEQRQEVWFGVTNILKQAGLDGRYQGLDAKDPKMGDDFKIVTISISQITCTPAELGQLLYLFEKESQVMEVENCTIDNMVNDTGQFFRSNNPQMQSGLMADNGLLRVDLQISRLIEYQKGEAPTKGRRS
jgi:hypothetical protein